MQVRQLGWGKAGRSHLIHFLRGHMVAVETAEDSVAPQGFEFLISKAAR
jgi:hypothetical protein